MAQGTSEVIDSQGEGRQLPAFSGEHPGASTYCRGTPSARDGGLCFLSPTCKAGPVHSPEKRRGSQGEQRPSCLWLSSLAPGNHLKSMKEGK